MYKEINGKKLEALEDNISDDDKKDDKHHDEVDKHLTNAKDDISGKFVSLNSGVLHPAIVLMICYDINTNVVVNYNS